MAEWKPCGERFVVSDVIRWVEPAWAPKTPRAKKSKKIGAKLVTAEVKSCEADGWSSLLVLSVEYAALPGWTIPKLEGVIRRRRGPIGQGGAERLLWSDESARERVASPFIGLAPDERQPDVPAAPLDIKARLQETAAGGGAGKPQRKAYVRRGRPAPKKPR